MNTLCYRRLFIEPEPEFESSNIITVKPLPTASENNIKKHVFCFLMNYTILLYFIILLLHVYVLLSVVSNF